MTIENVDELVRSTPEYAVLRDCGSPKANARTAYDAALIHAGMMLDTQEDAGAMFKRAGDFVYSCINAMERRASEIYEDVGLAGGATGSGSLADIVHLSDDESKDLFNITAALHQAEIVKRDLVQELIAWGRTKPSQGKGEDDKDPDQSDESAEGAAS